MKITPSEINKRNREFWDAHHKFFKELAEDTTIHATAVAIMQSENARNVAWTEGDEFNKALEIAADAKVRALQQQATKGGKTQKSNALYDLIIKIVRAKSDITVAQLFEELKRHHQIGIIKDIDDEVINFENHDGKLRTAQTSGLKHRLTRARKALVSETR